jgi:hypothetical protein
MDLNSFWIKIKAALFFVLGVGAAALLLIESPKLQTAGLLAVAVWSFCRLYYFLFYVIEKYVDPGFKFAGIGGALWYLIRRRR